MCLWCTHFNRDYSCSAFPEGIPNDILFKFVDHRKPVAGDNGIRFQSTGEAGIEGVLRVYDELKGQAPYDPIEEFG